MYVYIQSEKTLWTVGFYYNGKWNPESDWDTKEEASDRVAYLNGGNRYPDTDADGIVFCGKCGKMK